uniref:Metalloendopeptidase n=1 Tax=Pseudonaja textilis TaxID=8673 RepID=A0A670Z915_PSETE
MVFLPYFLLEDFQGQPPTPQTPHHHQFVPELSTPDRQSVKIIQEAFEDFAKSTCIQFVPYSYQRDFISIVPLSGCFSSAGRIGGLQVVSLAPDCLKRGRGVVLHELMHVLGFWHEHSRADRDKYISISWNEILTGFEINFIKNWNTNMLDDYDYSSIMHYGRNAFSMTGLPTIIPLSRPSTFLGQRWNLSVSDIAKINKLYKCSQVAAQPGNAQNQSRVGRMGGRCFTGQAFVQKNQSWFRFFSTNMVYPIKFYFWEFNSPKSVSFFWVH